MSGSEGEILKCEKVAVRFGGVQALNGVNFSVRRGSITAIIGPNGAGKTTLLNVISGLVNADDGMIEFDGSHITRMPPHERGRAGLVRTFQNLEIFTNMSVLENVMTGCHRLVNYSILDSLGRTPKYWKGERACREHAERELGFVGLTDAGDMMAHELPFGSQRLLELARAISSEPRLLLLDEPAAGLNMRETRNLGAIIKRIGEERGITIVLVEHDMDLVMRISDRITVLNFGEVIAEGAPLEIQKNPDVIAAYLGVEEEG
ncbi:MAG TPA: ABC transporter ATP-binding protein [Thermodesulfovibrionales bacterium]|nr:ABC transporter ATP-binding protein [Thermodesulfovibrionales bacterium]